MEAGESGNNLRPSFDCTDIIEQVISRTTAKQGESIKIIAESVETQRKDLIKMVEAIIGLSSALTTTNRVRQTATTTSTNVSNEETLLENQNVSNVHLRTQPEHENGSSVHMRT